MTSRDKDMEIRMKLAVPRYAGRISPRFGFTQDILVADVGGGKVPSWETLPIDRHLPEEIPALLARRGVEMVLTGGMNLHFQNLFLSLGIEVIWGLIGTPEEAVEAFLAGAIRPGMGCCPAGRRPRRHRRGPTWG
jgi:predicted Fe-Mo cluster-binding NifX family protein